MGGLSLLLLSLLGEHGGVRVQTQHNLLVLERVLLLHVAAASEGLSLGGVEGGLDFRRVDETGQVGLGDDVGGEEEVALVGGGAGGGAVDLVEGLEGGGGPDDETTQVATGGELEKVEGGDGGGLDTGNVAESLDDLLAVDLGVVDDERTAALAVTTATKLTLTGTELLGGLDLVDVSTSSNGLEESDGGGGAANGRGVEESRVDYERDLGDGVDLVTTGEQERRSGRSSKGRAGSVTPGGEEESQHVVS